MFFGQQKIECIRPREVSRKPAIKFITIANMTFHSYQYAGSLSHEDLNSRIKVRTNDVFFSIK